MSDVVLQLIWVAAHHGLRVQWPALCGDRDSRQFMDDQLTDPAWRARVKEHGQRWRWTREITAALGNPPAPGGPR